MRCHAFEKNKKLHLADYIQTVRRARGFRSHRLQDENKFAWLQLITAYSAVSKKFLKTGKNISLCLTLASNGMGYSSTKTKIKIFPGLDNRHSWIDRKIEEEASW